MQRVLGQLRTLHQRVWNTVPKSSQKMNPVLESLQTGSPKQRKLFSILTSTQLPSPKLLFRLDGVFARYLKGLNEARNYQDVLRAFEKFGPNNFLRGRATEQYLFALSKQPHLGGSLFSHQEGHSANPIHVALPESKATFLFNLILLWLMIFFLVQTFWFKNKESRVGSLLGLTPKSSLVERPNVTFQNVKGCYEAKEELKDLIDILRNPTKYKDVKIPRGILMSGPPGTGKTLLARALAGEAKVPFLLASGSEFEEMLVGVGARRIRNLFAQAKKNAPCIIFIDELDAVGGQRKGRSGEMALNQLLVELDGFEGREGVILIGATNLPDNLDPALVRPGRFDRVVHLKLPDVSERKEILDYYLKKFLVGSDVDSKVLSQQTAGLSGADIENMVNYAAIETISASKTTLDMTALETALFSIVMGREQKSMVLTPKIRDTIAYHESGHALVGLFSEHSLDVRKATIVPRGGSLGLVNFLPKDEPMVRKCELIARLKGMMGGRAAEELIFGKDVVTTGASNDLEKATQLAFDMVTRYGMSETVGHVFIDPRKDSDGVSGNPEQIEKEVKRLTEEAYRAAFELLKEHQGDLHLLANALKEYETLDVDEIRRVLKGEELHERKLLLGDELSQQRAKEVQLQREKEYLDKLKIFDVERARAELEVKGKEIARSKEEKA